MQKITKAIIPVAGWGTRRLPITKVIEKCMLPIGNRPIVDYVVQDCLKARITDIYFVIGENSTQLRDFYRTNIDLNDYLKRNNKEDLIELLRPPKVNLHYVVQSSYGKYGTAIPVSLAANELSPGESVAVLMGDDCIFNEDESSDLQRLIDAASDGSSAMLGVKIPPEDVSRYGVIEKDENNKFVQIVEKPSVEDAPSNLINVSKYVLNYEMIQAIKNYSKEGVSGEYYITEPINKMVSSGEILKVVEAQGKYMDSGTAEGWLKANQEILSQQSKQK